MAGTTHARSPATTRRLSSGTWRAQRSPRRHDPSRSSPIRAYPVSLTQPATSTLLSYVDEPPNDLLADLGIDGVDVSRFAFRAAPRRIDLEPDLAGVLLLD